MLNDDGTPNAKIRIFKVQLICTLWVHDSELNPMPVYQDGVGYEFRGLLLPALQTPATITESCEECEDEEEDGGAVDVAHVVYFQDKSGTSLLASFDKGIGVTEKQMRLQMEQVAADRFDQGAGAVRYQNFGEDYGSATAAKEEFDAANSAGTQAAATVAASSGAPGDNTVRKMDWSELGFTPIPGEAESKVIDGRRPCRSRFELKANSDHLHRVGRGGGNGSRGAGTREAAKRDELRLLIVGLDTQHQIRSEPM